MKKLVVTIDGPSGAGKTTVSRILADRLAYKYVDTGALYRGVAFAALAAGVSSSDEKGLESLCRAIRLKFIVSEKGLRLFLDSMDITDEIRTPEISMLASAVSARSVVRSFLLDVQREMGRERAAVFEGRDMGTVVFPEADIKFYLDASPKARAVRRHAEMSHDVAQTLDEVERDMAKRDRNDSSRALAPLRPAEDAVTIDSTGLSIEKVIELMLLHIEGKV